MARRSLPDLGPLLQAVYRRVAADPNGECHFHRGPACAARVLGYDPGELARLPADVTSSFAGREFGTVRPVRRRADVQHVSFTARPRPRYRL